MLFEMFLFLGHHHTLLPMHLNSLGTDVGVLRGVEALVWIDMLFVRTLKIYTTYIIMPAKVVMVTASFFTYCAVRSLSNSLEFSIGVTRPSCLLAISDSTRVLSLGTYSSSSATKQQFMVLPSPLQ